MSSNFDSPAPIQPLNIGDVVTGSFRLYRLHIKDYFFIALKAYVWILIPFYGWAKYYALSAMISRLCFGELINQPEDIKSAQRFVNSRLGQFFLQLLLMFVIAMGISVGFFIIFGIAGGVVGGIFAGLGQNNNVALILLAILLSIAIFVALFIGLSWVLTRFNLIDVTLAIEEDTDATSAISRSLELTKGNVWRIFGVMLIAFLITLPLQFIVQIITTIVQIVFTPLMQENSVFSLIYFLLFFAVSFSSGAVILPFWQAIKGTIYYDLRSRREGLGLRLRDHEI